MYSQMTASLPNLIPQFDLGRIVLRRRLHVWQQLPVCQICHSYIDTLLRRRGVTLLQARP